MHTVPGDELGLPLAGGDVVRCSALLPSSLELQLTTGRMTISGPFVIRVGDTSQRYDPGDRATLALAISRLLEEAPALAVASAIARADGSLALTFTSGLAVEVPSGEYEAWEASAKVDITSPEWWIVLSAAGGGLATWGLSAASRG